jgi:hypothetical protein
MCTIGACQAEYNADEHMAQKLISRCAANESQTLQVTAACPCLELR